MKGLNIGLLRKTLASSLFINNPPFNESANLLFSDMFTGTNGTNLNGRIPDNRSAGEVWSVLSGAFNIQGNRISSSGTIPGYAVIDGKRLNFKLFCYITITTNDTHEGYGLVFRFQNISNLWTLTVKASTSTLYLKEIIDGVENIRQFQVISGLNTGGHLLMVMAVGQEITYSVDGEHITTYSTSTQALGTKVGLKSGNIANQKWDNFEMQLPLPI